MEVITKRDGEAVDINEDTCTPYQGLDELQMMKMVI